MVGITGKETGAEEAETVGQKKNKAALQFHFVHHKSKITWPVVRPGPMKVLKCTLHSCIARRNNGTPSHKLQYLHVPYAERAREGNLFYRQRSLFSFLLRADVYTHRTKERLKLTRCGALNPPALVFVRS